jgi:hypothetical protein
VGKTMVRRCVCSPFAQGSGSVDTANCIKAHYGEPQCLWRPGRSCTVSHVPTTTKNRRFTPEPDLNPRNPIRTQAFEAKRY